MANYVLPSDEVLFYTKWEYDSVLNVSFKYGDYVVSINGEPGMDFVQLSGIVFDTCFIFTNEPSSQLKAFNEKLVLNPDDLSAKAVLMIDEFKINVRLADKAHYELYVNV